jgi:hypothetical protein
MGSEVRGGVEVRGWFILNLGATGGGSGKGGEAGRWKQGSDAGFFGCVIQH